MRFLGYLGILGLVFLCSCATENPVHPDLSASSGLQARLPAALDMNQDAGRGEWLFVNVRMEGEELPFFLDTGARTSCIDKSLEPKLGTRFTTMRMRSFEFTNDSDVYLAPAFYLGTTRLTNSGTYVMAMDCRKCSQLAGRPVMGILGIDVLSQYCLQLDFAANKVCFLDDEHLDKSSLGTAFPLKEAGGCYAIAGNLVGADRPGSIIDIGDNADGWLVPQLYQPWTHRPTVPAAGQAGFPNGILGGELYTGLDLNDLGTNYLAMAPLTLYNGLGLQFFARNLVTLDFPKRTLYLKQTSVGPFLDRNFRANAKTEGNAALKFLVNLRMEGILPGWPGAWETARKITVHFSVPDSVTADFFTDATHVYHYQISRPSKKAQWQMHRAWLTDLEGKTIREYPVN